MAGSVIDVHSCADLKAELEKAGHILVVIDFYATWCGPCKAIGPKIEKLAKERHDVIFIRVDVEECEDIVTQYDITNMPTFVFVKEGKTVKQFSGANYDLLFSTIQENV